MLVAYLISPGNISLKPRKVPHPEKGELLIKVRTTLTCGTDLKAYERGHNLIPMPGPFGHEFSGVIAETGTGLRKFREGDAIMAVHSAPCLQCRYCMKGLYNLCENIMDTKVLGAFAEYVLLPSHIVKQNTYIKPADLSFQNAAMLEPLACIVHPYARIDLARIDNALIIGAGPIGLLHLLFLRSKGIQVSVTDLNARRVRSARDLGVQKAASPERIPSLLKTCTAGSGFDLVVECTGRPEVWERSVDLVRKGGTVILFGGCRSGTTVNFDAGRLHYDEIALLGSFHFTPADVRNAYNLLAKGILDVSPLITGEAKLGDIQSVFEKLKKGTGIKYAITP